MHTEIIRLCGSKAEARELWLGGMFHPQVREHLERVPSQPKSRIALIKEYRDRMGCSISEAKRVIDETFVAEYCITPSYCLLLQYCEDGAISCGNGTPEVMRKIGNVWVPVSEYDECCSESSLFSDSVVTLPVKGLDRLKARAISEKDAQAIFHSLTQGQLYRISDSEVWRKDDYFSISIYSAGTLDSSRYDFWHFRGFLESRLARRKNRFGEF